MWAEKLNARSNLFYIDFEKVSPVTMSSTSTNSVNNVFVATLCSGTFLCISS